MRISSNQEINILVVNAGSSSIKFSVFSAYGVEQITEVMDGQISGIGGDVEFKANRQKKAFYQKKWLKKDAPDRDSLLDKLLEFLDSNVERKISIAGHRVVHGGTFYSQPQIINSDIIDKLNQLIPLAPLHQPHNLAPIIRLNKKFPHIKQIACFDTSYHRTKPWYVSAYALPKSFEKEGVIRYGFHGLSYEYISNILKRDYLNLYKGKVIVCHLGNGCSLCAIENGKSIDTTMGFSALEGIPMGTRPGNVDPGIFLYLMREKKMTVEELEELLYKKSGMLGYSGISNDMRKLIKSESDNAKSAIELFCFRVAKEIGALISSMQGIDALVFTAGIGENSPEIRQKITDRLSWLGIDIDISANQKNNIQISNQNSKIPVLVIPTNEELMIAKHSLQSVYKLN